jgi:hypothetical protein
VFELDLSDQERSWFEESAAAVLDVVAVLGKG